MPETPRHCVPWIRWEEITLAAYGFKNSTPSRFRNSTEDDVSIDALLFDANGNIGVELRWGKRGKPLAMEDFIDFRALSDGIIMNQATDGSLALWKFRQPVLFSPKQTLVVSFQDTTAGARVANVILTGRDTVSGEPAILTDRVEIVASGQAEANPQTRQIHPVEVSSFGLYLEETGTAAKMRGLKVRVSGGALPSWSLDLVPASLVFPHRNGAASVLLLDEPIRLGRGETLDFEVRETAGGTPSVQMSAIGRSLDRRS